MKSAPQKPSKGKPLLAGQDVVWNWTQEGDFKRRQRSRAHECGLFGASKQPCGWTVGGAGGRGAGAWMSNKSSQETPEKIGAPGHVAYLPGRRPPFSCHGNRHVPPTSRDPQKPATHIRIISSHITRDGGRHGELCARVLKALVVGGDLL